MKSWTKKATVLLFTLIGTSCSPYVQYRQAEPWNFPPEEEWNAPLETSWINAIDSFRKLTTPKRKTLDTSLFEQDTKDFNDLDRDVEEDEMYQ